MCCKIDKKHKAQIAKYFPPGWKFFFDPTLGNKKSNVSFLNFLVKKLDGLIFLSPNGSPFYSVERAVNRYPTLFSELEVPPQRFYDYVGISLTNEERRALETPKRAQKHESLIAAKRQKLTSPRNLRVPAEIQTFGDPSVDSSINLSAMPDVAAFPSNDKQLTPTPLTPTQLYQRRCRRCARCTKNVCTKCRSCVFNECRTRKHKEVCLRKVCRVSFVHSLNSSIFLTRISCS
jgi:hypothetical protein